MICTGCGRELPARASRGRPARFHNAACRQRAHRARHASRHHDVLAALTELEAAASELRRALLAGGDTTEGGSRLAAASTAVGALLPDATPTASPSTEPPVAEPVTKSVTEPRAKASAAEPSASAPARAPQREPAATRPFRSVTKRLTKRDRPAPIDLNTVRVERNPDPSGRTWRVLAGDADNPTLVGYVESAHTVHGTRNSRRWTILTAELLPITSRAARNRTQAVAALLDAHQRAAGVDSAQYR